jgi:TonB family protein
MTHDDTIHAFLDAVHSCGVARDSCTINVAGRSAQGLLRMQQGLIVHARYADAEGLEAVGRLLADGPLHHDLRPGGAPQPGNMSLPYQPFLLDALGRLEAAAGAPPDQDLNWSDVTPELTRERRLRPPPLPSARPAPPPPILELASAELRDLGPVDPGPPSTADGAAAIRSTSGSGHPNLSLLLAAGTVLIVALVAVAIFGGQASARARPAAEQPAPTDPSVGAVEASALEGEGAELPVLAAGEAPASPLPELGLKPTIVCRLLIDSRGQVVRAEVHQPRGDLEGFEAAALQAARSYRFAPARRHGVPVASWLHWPVQFR